MYPRSEKCSVFACARVRQSRILVVEDERHIAKFLEYILTKDGYAVAVEYDGEHALPRAITFCPDVILLDLVLPGISGPDLLPLFREQHCASQLKIVALSARWYGAKEHRLREAGADAQWIKPIAPTTLIQNLHAIGVPPRLSC